MAKANKKLITAILVTIKRLENDAHYEWGHLGACNCGHLAQTLTARSKREIHEAALARVGDWGEVSEKYCETSGMAIDTIISEMLSAGLALEDIEHLENLDDPKVLKALTMPGGRRYLKHNSREDLVLYLDAWAGLLEAELPVEPKPDPTDGLVELDGDSKVA